MKVVISEEGVRVYKQAIGLAYAIISANRISTPISSSILLSAGTDSLSITAVVEDRYSICLSCPATVQAQGSVVMSAATLNNMTKRLAKSSVLISAASNKLSYDVPVLGVISEPILNSQSIIPEGDLYDPEGRTEMHEVIPCTSTLGNNIRVISNFGAKGGLVRLVCTDNCLDIYGSYGSSGFVRYRDPLGCNRVVDTYIPLVVARLLPALGDALSVSISEDGGVIEFSCSNRASVLRAITCQSDSAEYESMDLILSEGVTSKVEVIAKELEAAIDWQSYKAEGSESLSLTMDSQLSRLVLKGVVDTPASISVLTTEGSMQSVDIPIDSARKAISAIRSGDNLTLEQRVLSVSGTEVKVMSLYPSKRTNGYGIALINEQQVAGE